MPPLECHGCINLLLLSCQFINTLDCQKLHLGARGLKSTELVLFQSIMPDAHNCRAGSEATNRAAGQPNLS